MHLSLNSLYNWLVFKSLKDYKNPTGFFVIP